MTLVGLEYLKQQEAKRSNLAREAETQRSNLANEWLSQSELTRKRKRDTWEADVATGELTRKRRRDTWEEDVARKRTQADAAHNAGTDATYYERMYGGVQPNSVWDILAQTADALHKFMGDVSSAKTLFR